MSIQKIERIKQGGGGGSAGEEVAVGYILIRQSDKYFKWPHEAGTSLQQSWCKSVLHDNRSNDDHHTLSSKQINYLNAVQEFPS